MTAALLDKSLGKVGDVMDQLIREARCCDNDADLRDMTLADAVERLKSKLGNAFDLHVQHEAFETPIEGSDAWGAALAEDEDAALDAALAAAF